MTNTNISSNVSTTKTSDLFGLEVELGTQDLLDWLDSQEQVVESTLSDAQRFENMMRQREIERARVADRFAPQRRAADERRRALNVFSAWARRAN